MSPRSWGWDAKARSLFFNHRLLTKLFEASAEMEAPLSAVSDDFLARWRRNEKKISRRRRSGDYLHKFMKINLENISMTTHFSCVRRRSSLRLVVDARKGVVESRNEE
jgi:hypothetical protein